MDVARGEEVLDPKRNAFQRPALPSAMRASEAAAISRALSGVTVT